METISGSEAVEIMTRNIITFLAIMANYGVYILIAIGIFFLMMFVMIASTNKTAEQTKKEVETLRKEIEAIHSARVLGEKKNGENAQ